MCFWTLCNNAGHLHNYCCYEKALNIIYSECVSVDLVIQHAVHILHIVICGLFGCRLHFKHDSTHAETSFVFRRNRRVHLNRQGRQFSQLLAAKVCASAVVMLVTPRSKVVWKYWLPTPFASFPFTSPPVRHRVPSHFSRTLPYFSTLSHKWHDFQKKIVIER